MCNLPPEILQSNGGRLLCVRHSRTGHCSFFSTYHVGIDRLTEQIVNVLESSIKKNNPISEITVCYYDTVYNHHTNQYDLTDYQQQVTFTPQFFLP